MKKKISFYTFGCRLNQAETAIIQKTFENEGFAVVDYRQPADVVVINTCTVTENGDADTRRMVNRINRVNPNAEIALVGCQAQVQREKLLDLPNVRWVVGNARKMELAEILRNAGKDSPQVITPVIEKGSFTLPAAGIDSHHTRANLKIQDGCDFFCSFCEIPYARGRARSRELPDLLAEAKTLAAAGHHELILTGINLGTYRESGHSFLDVIEALETIPDLWRIRISSIEPTTIPDGLLDKMRAGGKLCRYLHIPLQSGSDAILAKMKRKYTAGTFADFLEMVWQKIPGIGLGTDVIVGFPGETREHFEETCDLLRALPLAYFHVFSYSDRDHARSSRFGEKVPREEIIRRSRILRELSRRKRTVFQQTHLGTVQTVLFEQQKDGFWNGLTATYIRVRVKSDKNIKNQLLPVRLEEIQGEFVTGNLV